ncbi:MAG: FixH family protein [Nitrospirota bacterium]
MKDRGWIVMIGLLSALVLAVTIATIVAGGRQFDGVVTERPYETGLAWDEAGKEQQRLGWTITVPRQNLHQGTNDLSLTVLGRDGKPLKNATILVAISRPASRHYDRTYEAKELREGRYVASVELPLFGHWDLRADIRQGTEHMEHRERIYAQE